MLILVCRTSFLFVALLMRAGSFHRVQAELWSQLMTQTELQVPNELRLLQTGYHPHLSQDQNTKIL